MFLFQSKFQCSNQGYSYANDSEYGLVRHQIRCRYYFMMDSLQPSKGSVAAQNIQFEHRFEDLGRLPIQHQLNGDDDVAINCLENDDKFGKGLNFFASAAEFPPGLCSSASISNVETLVSIILQQRPDLCLSRECVSSIADHNKAANGSRQQNLL